MGTRTTTADTPPRTSSLRDYRTLTLPAVAPTEDGWQSMPAHPDGPRTGRTAATRVSVRTAAPSRNTVRMRRNLAPLRLERDDIGLGMSAAADTRLRVSAHREAAPVIAAPDAPRAPYRRKLGEVVRHAEPLRSRASTTVTLGGKAVPVWLLANLALLLAIGLGIAVPRLVSVDAASACNWHTVRPGDTLGNLGWQYHSSAMALARANHIANPNLIYVGQTLCIPMSATAQAPAAPAVPAVQGQAQTFTGQTARNEQSFVQLALPYAVSAHQQCNWPVSLILAQWGVEHGWSIPGFTGYNWGNSSAIPGFPSVPGLHVVGSPAAFAYAKTPADGVRIYVTFCKMGYYTGVAPAAASGGVNAAAVALGRSPWDAGHYTNVGSPGSSLLTTLRVYNLYYYDDPAHQGQQPAAQPATTTQAATTKTTTSGNTSSNDNSGDNVGDNNSGNSTSGSTPASSPSPVKSTPSTTPAAPPAKPQPSGPVGLAPEPCSPQIPASVWSVSYQIPWTVPPGCYAGVFTVNPANYVQRSGYGWCNWWVEVLRPDEPTLPWGSGFTRSSTPRVGATVFFAPFNQGASPVGHYAHVEAISPDGGWVLVSEMNDTWRGAGFAKVNYRFVKVEPGVTFIY